MVPAHTLWYGPPWLGSQPGSYELGVDGGGAGAPYKDAGGSAGAMAIGIGIPKNKEAHTFLEQVQHIYLCFRINVHIALIQKN